MNTEILVKLRRLENLAAGLRSHIDFALSFGDPEIDYVVQLGLNGGEIDAAIATIERASMALTAETEAVQ